MKSAAILAAVVLAISAAPVAAQEAACLARDVGQPPAQAEAIRVTAFQFTDGHVFFERSVTLHEWADGTGLLTVAGGGHRSRDIRTPWCGIETVRLALAGEEVARLNSLADESGAFDHVSGTWDQQDGRTIYLHCQTLRMTRVDPAGSRESEASIGCNRPDRLMPLVDAVIDLAGIGMVRENWAGFAPGH